MPSRPRRAAAARTAALALALATVLAGCGHGAQRADEAADATPAAAWEPAADPVPTGGLVWVKGTTVHLGDGSTIEADRKVGSFAVAGDGVYFTSGNETDLYLVTPAGTEATGAHATYGTVKASPDGRYLAFIDRTTGPTDQFGTPLAQTVVVDTATGEEVVRSSAGMGDVAEDDLADLYPELPPTVSMVGDDVAYVETPDGYYEYELPSGEETALGDEPWPSSEEPWNADLYEQQGRWNPARTWAITDAYNVRPRLVSREGTELTPRVPRRGRWGLTAWVDDRTARGYVGRALMTCTVPDGACRVVPGSEGAYDPTMTP